MRESKDPQIGKRIKQRRLELELTQAMLKEKTSISSGNLSGIENGDTLPSAQALVRLGEALNCSVDWILTGKNFDNTTTPPQIKPTEQNAALCRFVDMYLAIDNEDRKEIELLLEYKYKKKENEKNAILSSFQSKINAG